MQGISGRQDHVFNALSSWFKNVLELLIGWAQICLCNKNTTRNFYFEIVTCYLKYLRRNIRFKPLEIYSNPACGISGRTKIFFQSMSERENYKRSMNIRYADLSIDFFVTLNFTSRYCVLVKMFEVLPMNRNTLQEPLTYLVKKISSNIGKWYTFWMTGLKVHGICKWRA